MSCNLHGSVKTFVHMLFTDSDLSACADGGLCVLKIKDKGNPSGQKALFS